MSSAASRVLGAPGEILRHILLLAAAEGGPIAGRGRLQMMVFKLLDIDGPAGARTHYGAGSDGPHSDVVDGEIDGLIRAGVISEDGPIVLTPGGREEAGRLAAGETRESLLAVKICKRLLNGPSPDEALAYIYCAYPDMREPASYERTRPDIERHVLSLRGKRRISAGRGAMLLGITLQEMWAKMRDRGIHLDT